MTSTSDRQSHEHMKLGLLTQVLGGRMSIDRRQNHLSNGKTVELQHVSANTTYQFFYQQTSDRWGLRTEFNWETLFSNLSYLSTNDDHRLYRMVTLARHGEGVHNLVR